MNPIVNKIRDKMKLPKTEPLPSPAPLPARRRVEKETKGRLPDLSHFEAMYNAETKRWSGSLRVPGSPGITATSGDLDLLNKSPDGAMVKVPEVAEDVTFTAEASALVKLCFKLDDLFREYLAKQKEPQEN